jgi:cell wall-associated NlpC family hydrolase
VIKAAVRPAAWALGIASFMVGSGCAAPVAPSRAPASSTSAPVSSHSPSNSDAMLQMLRARGLAPATSSVQQVRDAASELVIAAMNFLDIGYRHGGASAAEGFDCSGFVRFLFQDTLGLTLPRQAAEQANDQSLVSVPLEQLKPGDLVFFNTLRRAFSHVGIYVGEGKFIHSPRAGAKVRVEDMSMAYWSSRFNGARRAPLLQDDRR